MLKHLEAIFHSPNKEANAKREFRKLNMKTTDKFQDFLTDFLHLAGEAKVPASMYKDELYQRITWKLQEITIREMMDSDTDFDAYTAVCTKLANHLSVINEFRNQNRQGNRGHPSTVKATEATTIPRTTERIKTSATSTETIKHEGTSTPTREFSPEKKELYRSGKCFYCKLTGHISKNCHRRKNQSTLKEIDTLKEIELEEEESENSQP
jgi:hypothetical protein